MGRRRAEYRVQPFDRAEPTGQSITPQPLPSRPLRGPPGAVPSLTMCFDAKKRSSLRRRAEAKLKTLSWPLAASESPQLLFVRDARVLLTCSGVFRTHPFRGVSAASPNARPQALACSDPNRTSRAQKFPAAVKRGWGPSRSAPRPRRGTGAWQRERAHAAVVLRRTISHGLTRPVIP